MRKNTVTLGAIQASHPYPPPHLEFLNPSFCGDVERLLKELVEPRIEKNLQLIEEAAARGCDIVTTSEYVTGSSGFLTDLEDSIFSLLVKRSATLADQAFSEAAKKQGMYVIACYHHLDKGKIYNRASLFGRNGELVGWYDKTQVPANEAWLVTSGDSLPVFALDFGTVGISICYEMMFPEIMGALSLKGAEFVFHPTAGYGWYDSIGEATLRTRANDGDLYLITAKNHAGIDAGKSSIIDFWGQVKADAGFDADVVVTHTVDLTRKKCQPDWYVPSSTSGESEMRARRKQERRPSLYAPLTDPGYTTEKTLTPSEKREVVEGMKTGKIHW